MKNPIENLNKNFENRVRLGIMSSLMVNDSIDFLTLKSILNVTDGNLASHSASLEKIEYIKIIKEFVGKKTKTTYKVTELGKQEFLKHIKALEELIKTK